MQAQYYLKAQNRLVAHNWQAICCKLADMAIVKLSDGTRVKSADIDNATLYAKSPGRKRNGSAGSEGRKLQTEDRLYVLLKNTQVLRLAGAAVREDAQKLHAAKVPVFINKAKSG